MPLSDRQGHIDSIPYRKGARSYYGGFASGQVGRDADYIARVNVMEKVLDCVQFGGLILYSPLEFLKCVMDSIGPVLHQLVDQIQTSGTNCAMQTLLVSA